MRNVLLAAGCIASATVSAAMLPDGDFENTAKGEKTGWRTTSNAGRVLAPGKGMGGSAAIGVDGVGTNNCKWLSPPVMV